MNAENPGNAMGPKEGVFEDTPSALCDEILKKVACAESDWTPDLLIKAVCRETGRPVKEVRSAIRELVAEGRLSYLVNHGRTCIRTSWQRPFFVGGKTQLLPPGVSPVPGDRIGIVLLQGASFGGGDHPTTRLCIAAIEAFVRKGGRMLDVGTGSGVLAIAAVRHGMASALGVDLDPVSLFEAKENVSLNGLDEKIEIRKDWVPSPSWDLVAANLRPPTLASMSKALITSLLPGAILVLSGMRHGEMDPVAEIYAAGLGEISRGEEKGWGCIVFQKGLP